MALQLKKLQPLPGLTNPQQLHAVAPLSLAGSPAPMAQMPTLNRAPVAPQVFPQVQSRAPMAQMPTMAAPSPWKGANVGNFFGSGLIENFLNSPHTVGTGLNQLTRGQYKQGFGNIVTGAIDGPLPIGKGVQAGLKGASLAFKVFRGAKVGSKQMGNFGAAYGGGSAMSQDASWGDVAKSTALGYGTGRVAGAVLGGGIPLAGAGIAKASKAAVNKIPEVSADFTPQVGKNVGVGGKAPVQPKTKPKVTGANRVNEQLNASVEAEKNRYKVSLAGRYKNKVMEAYNPANPLAKIDRATAKSKGIKFKDLPASQRLEHLHDISSNSRQQAAEMLATPTRTGSSANDIIKLYGEGTPAGKEFNNYTNAKFDLEFRAKHGKQIQAGVSTEDLKAFVKAYEAKDPNALHGLATKKAINDQAVDTIVAGGGLSKAEGETVKNAYKNAVPLGRLFSEDLQRVQVGGNSRGSISKQTVVQSLEGNSHIPLDNSFTPLVNRVNKAVSQANRAKLAQAYSERVRAGTAPGELLVGAGNKSARKDLAAERLSLNKGINGLSKEISLNAKWARKLETEINSLNKQGFKVSLKKTTEPSLVGKLVDPSIKMSAAEVKNVVNSLVNLSSKDITKLQSKIATREPKLAARLNSIIESKKNIEGVKEAKNIIKESIAQLQDDPTTGRQVISGLVDGEQFKIEVPPEIAKTMQGLDETQLNAVLKVGHAANKVFQTAWTGFLQPAFSLISYSLYDPAASVIISKQGFKTFRPAAISQMFKSFTGSNAFSETLKKNGYLSPGGSMMARNATLSAEKIAASNNVFSKMKFNITHPKEMLESLDVLGGKLANSSRERIGKAHYVAAKKAGMTEKDAIAEGVYAANNVLPNYQRTSALAKQLNSVFPYVGASVAGTRSMTRALGSDPKAWARLIAIGVAPVVATTAYSLGSDSGQEFYKDMHESGKDYVMDNNIVVVLPGANKDAKTGKWSGVWKIPIAPELRALNKSTWRGAATAIHGGDYGANSKVVATSIFDTMTGGLRGQSNPVADSALIALNVDPNNFGPIVKGNLAQEAKKDQIYSSTSTAGTKIAGITGNKISPIQADKILGQFSLVGELAQNRGGNPAKTVADNISRKFEGAYGQSEAGKYYKSVSNFTEGLSQPEKSLYAKINPAKKNSRGEVIFTPNKLTKASDYADMIANPDFTKKYQEFQKSSDKHDPLWDLDTNQLRSYMQAQVISKNNPGGDSATVSALYKRLPTDFFTKREKFFADMKAGASAKGEPWNDKDYTPRPKMPDNLVSFSESYHNLPYGTGARSAALRSAEGQAYVAYLNQNKIYNNQERADLGLPPLEDTNSKYGSGSSKINPDKFAVSLKGVSSAPSVSIKKLSGAKLKLSTRSGSSRPKVTIKKSKV